ncbi:MAG: aquaporin [Pseudolysinimonas sp.]
MADAPSHSLLSRLIAEVFGTFMLVFGVVGAALFLKGSLGALGPALAVGLAVLTAAYAVGHISGGHFNPAVTLGAASAGRMLWKDVLPYIGAQLVGGIFATLVLWLISATSGGKFTADFAAVSNGYGNQFFGIGAVIVLEIVITCLFLWVILGVTAPNAHVTAGFAPFAIGLTLTLFHLIAIPVDNASLNPARSIATAVLGGGVPLSEVWVFILAPVVGALIAGFSWKALFGRTK